MNAIQHNHKSSNTSKIKLVIAVAVFSIIVVSVILFLSIPPPPPPPTLHDIIRTIASSDEGIHDIDPVIIDQLTSEDLTIIGDEVASKRMYNKAIESYKIALGKDSENIDARIGIAYSHTELDQFDDAQFHYGWARHIDPNNVNFINGYGYLLTKLYKFEEAIEDYYSIVLEIDGRNVNALNGMATSHLGLGNYAKSIEIFQESLTIEPDNPATLAGLGEAHLNNGQIKKAIEAYNKAEELDPENPHIIEGSKAAQKLQNEKFKTEEMLSN